MQDNALISIFAARIEAGIAAYNVANPSNPWQFNGVNYPVVQKNDVTQEGIPTSPTVFFERLFDDRYGWPSIASAYVAPVSPATQGTYNNTENQWIESTFQVSALVPQDPTNLTLPTPSDVVNYVAQWLQSRASIYYFKANGITMYRAANIRQVWFADDKELFESQPNFDICFQHQRSLLDVVPATKIIQESGIYPI